MTSAQRKALARLWHGITTKLDGLPPEAQLKALCHCELLVEAFSKASPDQRAEFKRIAADTAIDHSALDRWVLAVLGDDDDL
jgi:hypothetical protein